MFLVHTDRIQRILRISGSFHSINREDFLPQGALTNLPEIIVGIGVFNLRNAVSECRVELGHDLLERYLSTGIPGKEYPQRRQEQSSRKDDHD